MKSTLFPTMLDEYDEMCKKLEEDRERRFFDQLKADGDITEAVLVLNPKHKNAAHELMSSLGAKIDILWSSIVEEDKAYMVWDKKVIEHIRQMRGCNEGNS